MLTEAPEHETPDDGYGEQVRPAFAVLLRHVADCLDAFGALVEAEAENSELRVERNLAESLDVAGEARAILTELRELVELIEEARRQHATQSHTGAGVSAGVSVFASHSPSPPA